MVWTGSRFHVSTNSGRHERNAALNYATEDQRRAVSSARTVIGYFAARVVSK